MVNKFLIKNPIITERAISGAAMGKYTFLTDSRATSSEVKKIIESEYNVKVVKTNVINAKSKIKRKGNIVGIRPGYKKIIVTLKKGQKLDILPQ
ncbi:50S ribosomal protein L23 [Patescibacteria group bacterium]|nr:50S ribosomal protein L23 [Patescibacteria group bacterium]